MNIYDCVLENKIVHWNRFDIEKNGIFWFSFLNNLTHLTHFKIGQTQDHASISGLEIKYFSP